MSLKQKAKAPQQNLNYFKLHAIFKSTYWAVIYFRRIADISRRNPHSPAFPARTCWLATAAMTRNAPGLKSRVLQSNSNTDVNILQQNY